MHLILLESQAPETTWKDVLLEAWRFRLCLAFSPEASFRKRLHALGSGDYQLPSPVKRKACDIRTHSTSLARSCLRGSQPHATRIWN